MAEGVTTIGIVGAGNVVTANHLPVLQAMDDIEVVWIADSNRSRAERVGGAYGVRVHPLTPGLPSLPPSDAVLLAIPYGVREPYYQAVAAEGKALYVEKPLARTVAFHRQLCSLFEDHRFACGLNRRAWGPVRLCRDLIRDELFGRLQRVRFAMCSVGGITTGAGYLSDARLAGGGALFEGGVHGIDTVLYCLGAKQAAVHSGEMMMDHGHDIHCEAVVSLTDARGATAPFEIEVSILHDGGNGITMEFDRATLSFSIFGPPALHVRGRNAKTGYVLTDEREYYPAKWNQVLAAFWRSFIYGFQTRSINYTSASQSLLTTKVIEDLYAMEFSAAISPGREIKHEDTGNSGRQRPSWR